jgi:hypothetical protein
MGEEEDDWQSPRPKLNGTVGIGRAMWRRHYPRCNGRHLVNAAMTKGVPMWASGHNGEIRRAAHGYEPTREAAMEAFAMSWRQQ